MMFTASQNRHLRALVTWTICLTMAFPPATFADDGFFVMSGFKPETTMVKRLAKRIDHLERELDECGSIVIKTPDVWGESRLMRHRSDVETQLKARLSSFDFRINAIQSTRDAAFLATAVALQERIRGSDVDVGPLTGSAPTGANVNNVNAATTGMIGNPNEATSSTSPPLVSRSPFLGVSNTSGLDNRTLKINIEPVIELDQLNRYLQHLNELRRLNEGDDNSDSPGYALNLIRIPVSVLPGRKTEEGFGAEVQITIDPNLSDEILPLAFKDFVINGVVDRISFDVFQLARQSKFADLNKVADSEEAAILVLPPPPDASSGNTLNSLSTSRLKWLKGELSNSDRKQAVQNNYQKKYGTALPMDAELGPKAIEAAVDGLLTGRLFLADVNQRDLAIPASHRHCVNGDTLQRIARHAYICLVQTETPETDVPVNHRVEHGLTMPEVRTLLTEETKAGYELLSRRSAEFLWGAYCTPELARKVREHRTNSPNEATPDSVACARQSFFDQFNLLFTEATGSVTEALAWQIIVESALLNERLVKDMKETASLKNCPCIVTDGMQFFGPDPLPHARMAFNEYVKCKWPIHVFALDPVTQDQNISDSFSARREMQIATAIAASNRLFGGQAMQRFVRRMEYDLETIQLNRTAIGFSHGDNTFGWRFHPRVQAPPVPSNLKVVTHDLLIGGQSRDSLARKYKLEPGIRECTALVVMPSFVPQVIVDVRTNWFRLAKHVPIQHFMKRRADYEDSIDLSREVTELRELHSRCAKDAHLYRDGEVYRLCKAVERLEGRLPLQTHHVSVPWENDLGGFEVFQSGTQVLGPEIHGWYGAPGIKVLNTNLERNLLSSIALLQQRLHAKEVEIIVAKARSASAEDLKKLTDAQAQLTGELQIANAAHAAAEKLQTSTAVYLVGKNFSVLNCRVIAGGVDVTNTIEVINRNLMQVRIPSSVSTVSANHTQPDVVVHLATPYGATSRLFIPVAGSVEASDAAKAAAEAKEVADAAKKAAGEAKTAAGEAKTAVDKAQPSIKLLEAYPVVNNWGDEDPQTFTVQGYFEKDGFEKYRFCPVAAKKTPIFVYQDLRTSPLPIAKPKRTLDEAKVGVTGQLMVVVTSTDLDKKQKFGPWDLKDGKLIDDDKKLKDLTANELYSRIHKGIRDDLPCKKEEETLTVTVTGYVRFKDDKRVVRLKNDITFQLEVIDKPEKK